MLSSKLVFTPNKFSLALNWSQPFGALLPGPNVASSPRMPTPPDGTDGSEPSGFHACNSLSRRAAPPLPLISMSVRKSPFCFEAASCEDAALDQWARLPAGRVTVSFRGVLGFARSLTSLSCSAASPSAAAGTDKSEPS